MDEIVDKLYCDLMITRDDLQKLMYTIEEHKYYKGLSGDVNDVKLWKVLEEVKGEL